MKHIFLHIAAACILLSCTTVSRSGDTAQSSADNPVAVHYHSSWLDGEVQNGYITDQQEVSRQLAKWDQAVPDPNDTDRYLEYLSVLDASSRSSEAEAKIKHYLAKYPMQKRAVFLLAVHYVRAHKKDLAAYLFRELERDQNFEWRSLVLNNLGMLSFEDKDRIRALEYFEKAAQSKPAHAAPLVNLGAIYVQSRNYSDAERLFRRAVASDERFEDAVLGLGYALEGQRKFEQAHEVYSEFISNNSSALSVVYNDAVLLGNQLQQKAKAIELMQRYIHSGGKESARAHEVIQGWR